MSKQAAKQITSQPSKTLETFPNPAAHRDYQIHMEIPEFTCLCPKTGQPDFAKFEIVYVPRIKMVESKSLKLYLFSFRNEGIFHEEVTNRIFKDLWEKMQPKFMRVIGDFSVRGGISIKPLVQNFAHDVKNQQQQKIIQMLESWDRTKSHLNP